MRDICLPGNEQWDEQFYCGYHEEECSRRAGEIPSSHAAETAEKDREAYDSKQAGVAIDISSQPPRDKGESNVRSGHEPKLAVKLRSHRFNGNVHCRAQEEAERAERKGQQTQNHDGDLKGALHVRRSGNLDLE